MLIEVVVECNVGWQVRRREEGVRERKSKISKESKGSQSERMVAVKKQAVCCLDARRRPVKASCWTLQSLFDFFSNAETQ